MEGELAELAELNELAELAELAKSIDWGELAELVDAAAADRRIKIKVIADGAVLAMARRFPVTLLRAAALDEHIAVVRHARAEMQPQPPAEWKQGLDCTREAHNPRWFLENTALEGDVILHVPAIGLGYLHYTFGKANARALAEALLHHIEYTPDFGNA